MLKVEMVETKTENGDNRLIMVVDSVEITVDGFGSGDYALKLRYIGGAEPSHQFAETLKAINRHPDSSTFWGEALTWAEPLTIAHLVMNVIDNQ